MKSIILIPIALLFLIGCDEVKEKKEAYEELGLTYVPITSTSHEVDTYDSGQLKSERNHKNGKKEGLWTWWDEEGNITKTEIWKNGELVK